MASQLHDSKYVPRIRQLIRATFSGAARHVKSAPGEDRLLEVIDALAGPAEQAHLAQLEEDRRGRRVDEVVAQRQLQDGAVALRDRDEPRLAVAQGSPDKKKKKK